MSKSNSINTKLYTEIENAILGSSKGYRSHNVGEVSVIGDGIAKVSGLSDAMYGETVVFDKSGTEGLVINLTPDEVGVIVLGDYTDISEGDSVSTSGNILSINVSEGLFGRVVNPMMVPVDGKGPVTSSESKGKLMPIEKIAPGIIYRESVSVPLQTGIKAVDGVIPIGRGQRELIIGDRNTGKTAVAVDAIINQAKLNRKKGNKRVISVFVAIGQKQSRIAQLIDKLESAGAMDSTIFVVANASDPVSLQYLAPYAGCAVAEYFMEKGEDVLIVYDDLTKHAWAYRQISLVLKRPSGREAYPGDIFYLHSKLLERSCRLSKDLGGGSMTALPIVETQAQDISAFIPTNIISITDGQIYLEPDLFYQGVRPAINVGLSVSRVGGAAQLKAMKQVAGKLKLDIAQFNELQAFAQFGSDMDNITKQKIERGRRIIEVLKQPQYTPLAVDEEILQIWLVTKGYLDNVELQNVIIKLSEFVEKVKATFPEFIKDVYSKEGISKESEDKLVKIAEKLCGSKSN